MCRFDKSGVMLWAPGLYCDLPPWRIGCTLFVGAFCILRRLSFMRLGTCCKAWAS